MQFASLAIIAQDASMNTIKATEQSRDKTFEVTLHNKAYNVMLKINLHDKNVMVPQQEIFGEVDGYLKSNADSRCWIITDSTIDPSGKKATLEIVNDYGSEDLVATLEYNAEKQTYILRQGEGSTIKLAKNGKWQKLPTEIELTK